MTSIAFRNFIEFNLDFIQNRGLMIEQLQIKLNMTIYFQNELPVPDLVEIRRVVL